jgi:hypothetical protein
MKLPAASSANLFALLAQRSLDQITRWRAKRRAIWRPLGAGMFIFLLRSLAVRIHRFCKVEAIQKDGAGSPL